MFLTPDNPENMSIKPEILSKCTSTNVKENNRTIKKKSSLLLPLCNIEKQFAL